MNLAAVWRLPVLFVCENNLYMEYTAIGAVTPVEHPAADRAPAYGLEPIVIDGNEVEAVRDTVAERASRAREGGGPAIVEAVTYRLRGHSLADPAAYRPAEEVERGARGRADRPLPPRARGARGGGRRADAVEADVAALVGAVAERARAAPPPEPATAWTDVWADGTSRWRS